MHVSPRRLFCEHWMTSVLWSRRTSGLEQFLARGGQRTPSLISLRLSSSRIEIVNAILERVLPLVEREVAAGAIVTVEDTRVRVRQLPIP